MNIRSMDLQVLFPKTTEVAKTQQQLNQQNTLQQHELAAQWQKISQMRQQQVQFVDPTGTNKVQRELDQEKQQQQQKRHQQKSAHINTDDIVDKQAEQPLERGILGRKVDIKT